MTNEKDTPLRRLLISRERGDFMKNLQVLIDALEAEQLAQWYVSLNARSWPEDCPLKPLGEDPQWSAQEFLVAIQGKVDARYLTLHWRAAGHAPERIATHARVTLTLPPPAKTYIREDWKPKGAIMICTKQQDCKAISHYSDCKSMPSRQLHYPDELPERLFVQVLKTASSSPVSVNAYKSDPRSVHDDGRPVFEYVRADLLATVRGEAFKEALRLVRDLLPTSAGAGNFKELAIKTLEAAENRKEEG